MQSVADTLAKEPALEAVTIDRNERRVSLATFGRTNEAALKQRLAETLDAAQHAPESERCCMLHGSQDCGTCALPSRPLPHAGLTVKQQGDGVMTIAKVCCPTAPSFWRWSDIPLPRLVPRQMEIPEDDAHLDEWKAQLVLASVCGVLGLAAYLAGAGSLSKWLYLGAYICGGWFAVEEVWERLQQRVLDVHFLMLAVAVGSASVGALGEGAMLLFLFSMSGALEHYAMGRTQREIKALFRTAPKVATTLDAQGREQETPVENLARGMRILVKPGAQFPVDAEVVKGCTASDESNLTGEAEPVEKDVGDTVLAGTMNLWGVVEATVLRPAEESALEKIVRLIREAQHLKAPSQRLTDRFGTGYTYGILGLTTTMFLVWWLGFNQSPFTSTPGHPSAFYRAMTLLVVASPCALVLSIPSAILAAIAWAARRGILFRGGAAVERLAEVDAVAMDKTGTLTTGELQVERTESFPPGNEQSVAELAFALEKLSTHPLARAVARHGKREGLRALEIDGFESVTGLGLRAKHQSTEVLLGRRDWVCEARGHGTPEAACPNAPLEPGMSEVWVSWGKVLGRVLLRDAIRPQSRDVVRSMRELGLHTVVLTGDRRQAAEALRQHVLVDEVQAELKPEQKVASIRAMMEKGRKVAMIGDGVNDAPSLAVAHVGVAMGARGSDAALEQAEIVLMHDRLENFLAAFSLSQRARRVIRQNLVISLGTVVVLVCFALLGKIPLTLGVVGHEGSTVVVVLNSLRLLLSSGGAASTSAAKDEYKSPS